MNDLDLVRAFRSDAPFPVDLVPLDFSHEQARDRRPQHRRNLMAAAAVLVASVGGVFALQTGPAAPPTEAAVVLDHAARVLADDVMPRPSDRQWLYYGSAQATVGQPPVHNPTAHNWQTFDGTKYADPSSDLSDLTIATIAPALVAHNQTPSTMYDAASALPSEPDALLKALMDSGLAAPYGDTEAARHYNAVVSVYSRGRLALVPTQVQANLLRALGTIPGVDIDEHAAPDLLGRPAVAVSFNQDDRYDKIRVRSELLLDPETYAFLGTRTTALETGEVPAGYTDDAEPLTADVRKGEAYKEYAAVGPVAVAGVGDVVDPVTGELTHHRVNN